MKVQPEVFSIIEVPRRSMTHNLTSIARLHQHGFVPKLFGHWQQTQRSEKFIGLLKHPGSIPTLEESRRLC